MKTCSHCSAVNPDVAKFCLQCGSHLSTSWKNQDVAYTSSPEVQVVNNGQATPKVQVIDQATPNQFTPVHKQLYIQRKVDIMFVLDCTGSMQGEIDAVRDVIIDFVESIESQSVCTRMGLIEFRDCKIQEEQRVIQFNGQPFTNDPHLFRQEISSLKAQGGGDEPESSLDAMMLALNQPFDPDASRVLVLITDAPPHIPDCETQTIEEVMHRIKQVKIDQIYLVMRTQDHRNHIYLKLLEVVTRGLAFDIGQGDDFRKRSANFKQTLMALGNSISLSTLGEQGN